jgi:hypothetical protein
MVKITLSFLLPFGAHHASLCISWPKFLINSIYTHMSFHRFFLMGYKKFGSLLITDCTSAINNFGKASQGVKKKIKQQPESNTVKSWTPNPWKPSLRQLVSKLLV